MDNTMKALPFDFTQYDCRLYPASVNRMDDGGWAFMAEKDGKDLLIVMGSQAGEFKGRSFRNGAFNCVEASLSAANAKRCAKFPYSPVPVLRRTAPLDWETVWA